MSEKSHLLLVDQQTLNTITAALKFFADPDSTDLGEPVPVFAVRTLVENLNTGFFTPDQGEVLRHFHQPELMSFAERAGDYHSINDECEIDDEPIFSEADGVWVNAWVWVPRED